MKFENEPSPNSKGINELEVIKNNIINLYGQEIANKIFAKYSEIIYAADNIEEYLKSITKESKPDKILINQIGTNLLKRVQQLLLSVKQGLSVEDINKNLENIQSSILLFGSVIKNLRKQGKVIELKDFVDVEFIVDESVLENEAEQMREIYARNYKDTPEFQKELLENFDHSIGTRGERSYGDGDNMFYLLKVIGRVVAFCRFHEDWETGIIIKKFGFFNVDQNYQGFQLGEIMMEQSLDLEAKNSILQATCTATASIAERYIQRGFIGTRFIPDYKGIPDLYIERNDIKNKEYPSKSLREEEIISKLGSSTEHDFKINDTEIKIISFNESDPLPFGLTNEGWILTQYFSIGKKKYTVFEKMKHEEKFEYGEDYERFLGEIKNVTENRKNNNTEPPYIF
ncbi:GNAT family N-acetyltransferase [Candidatus Nomurabacteria bacterium]|nr:GNAT family N-acetyltransferase [Candidatus Nomurabacteria bacterium]